MMKKKKTNPMKSFAKWKKFLTAFEENEIHTEAFPEELMRAASEDKIVFHAHKSNVVFGTIFKDIPLVIILLIHPHKQSVELFQFADETAKSFLGPDSSVTYPEDVPSVSTETVDERTREVLLLAFPQEIVEQLLSEET
ncbi:MAG: hypothetical protein ACOC0U_07250 [Desulfovibrionales bacterium]